MKARETLNRVLGRFSDVPLSQRELLLLMRILMNHLSDCVFVAQLADGKYLRDAIDFTAWLRELEAAAALELDRINQPPAPVKPIPPAKFCHACGHPHKDERECGMQMGAGVCSCRVEVLA